MTGTGTQTDPYAVDNWEDLTAAVKNDGAYIECRKGTVIDLEEISTTPTEYTLTLSPNVTINGNGAVIQNGKLKLVNKTYPGYIRFSDFNFIDIITNSEFIKTTAASSSYPSWNFTRCEINVFGAGGAYFVNMGYSYSDVSFNSCNITYDDPNGIYFYLDQGALNVLTHNYCNLYIKCLSLHAPHWDLKAPDFVNCYLAGELLNTSAININSYRINYSILEIKGNYYISPYAEGKGNVINSELTSDRGSSSAVTYLTTEEIRDPQKLYTAGLLIDPNGG